MQATVDNTVMAMTPLSAVPYALEADTASNAAPKLPALRGLDRHASAGRERHHRFNTDYGGYEIFSNGFWFRQEPMLSPDGARTRSFSRTREAISRGPFPLGSRTSSPRSGVRAELAERPEAGPTARLAGGGGHSRGIIPVAGLDACVSWSAREES